MPKTIRPYDENRDRILAAVRKVAAPVVGTLSPQGSNVIFEDQNGNVRVTNDGWTIINAMDFEDRIDHAMHSLLRDAARKTNLAAGDGTTSTTLFASTLVEEGFRALDEGESPLSVKRSLDKVPAMVESCLSELTYPVRTRKDLEYVARVSSNDDAEVARNVVEAVEAAGDEGLVFIEDNTEEVTTIVKDDGFMVEAGLMPILANQPGKLLAVYKDVKVLVTDKRLYHDKEALAIIDALLLQGITQAVVVAKDFLGVAKHVFLTNHRAGKIQLLLVKDPTPLDDPSLLEDLAVYLGTELVTDRTGKLAKGLSVADFGTAKRVVADHDQTLLYGKAHPGLKARILEVRSEVDRAKGKDKDALRKRLARMTNGTVTIQVGGRTAPEIRERMFRYEDAVHATKAAKKDGYVVGGGLTLRFIGEDYQPGRDDSEVDVRLLRALCSAPLRQIARNCELDWKTLMASTGDDIGYNAASGKYEDLLKAGVIEPATVVRMAVGNAASVASLILSSRHIITTDHVRKD